MIIRATITSPSDALIPNKIVRTKVVTLKFGSDINILDAPPRVVSQGRCFRTVR